MYSMTLYFFYWHYHSWQRVPTYPLLPTLFYEDRLYSLTHPYKYNLTPPIMMMTNCFCGMFYQQIACSLVFSCDHFKRFSPSQISNMVQERFEPVQNLSWGFVEWCWAVVTATTPLTTTPQSWICWIKLNNSNARN